MRTHSLDRSRPTAGFTLIELLVVITIIVLVSAVTLPTVLPALNHRQVGEAARILQAALVGARDQAIRDNSPRGIRLLPDPMAGATFNPTTGVISNASGAATTILAYNRFIPIETAGDYSNGLATISLPQGMNFTAYVEAGLAGVGPGGTRHPALRVDEEAVSNLGTVANPNFVPNERTSWFWNIRIGDKIRFNSAGRYYTVVGPMVTPNPELFVNDGSTAPMTLGLQQMDSASNIYYCEYLYLVNGHDDNNDGFVDNGWDGFDNNYNGITDEYSEWFNPTTNVQWEDSQWVGTEFTRLLTSPPNAAGTLSIPDIQYTIIRRPTPVAGAREVTLPGGIVVDATTGFPFPVTGLTESFERSRLPIDPKTLYVDILVNTNGQVVPTTEYSSPTGSSILPFGSSFFHFWLTERQDLHESTDLWGVGNANPNSGTNSRFVLPLPQSYYSGLTSPPTISIQGERTLLTLFTRTGQLTSNSIENFSISDVNAPFYAAQSGVREAK